MLGELKSSEIEDLLKSQVIGRIGCHADGEVYVVPVTYVYDGAYVYAHSAQGLKISMMRKNPVVCFEVDTMRNLANWQSVIARGRFEELTKEIDRKYAIQKLKNRLSPLIASETAQPAHGLHPGEHGTDSRQAILFRIKLVKKTGRFEER